MAKVNFEGGGIKVISEANADATPIDDTKTLMKRPDGQPAEVPTKYLGYYENKGFVKANPLDFPDVIKAATVAPKMSKAEMKKIIKKVVAERRQEFISKSIDKRREELELQDVEEKKILKVLDKLRKSLEESEELKSVLADTEAEITQSLLERSTKRITAPDPGVNMVEGVTSSMEM